MSMNSEMSILEQQKSVEESVSKGFLPSEKKMRKVYGSENEPKDALSSARENRALIRALTVCPKLAVRVFLPPLKFTPHSTHYANFPTRHNNYEAKD